MKLAPFHAVGPRLRRLEYLWIRLSDVVARADMQGNPLGLIPSCTVGPRPL